MSEPIDVEELMRRIGVEVAQRREHRGEAPAPGGPATIPRPWAPPASLALRESYNLAEFLVLEDADFVEAAYRGVLRRAGDPQGSAHYLEELRNGRMSKVEVLGRLRYSGEGRARAVRVHSLLPQLVLRSLYRIPVLGYLAAWLGHLLRLPTIVRNFERFEGYGRTHLNSLYASDAAQADAIDASLDALRAEARHARLQLVERHDLQRVASDLDASRSRVAADLDGYRAHVEGELDALRARAGELDALRARVGELDTLRARVGELDTLQVRVGELDALRARAGELDDARRAELQRLATATAELQSRIDTSIAAIDARVGQAERIEQAIDARLGQAEQNEQTIAAAQARLGEQLGVLASAQLDRTALEAQLARVDQRLEAKADHSSIAALNERLLAMTELKADRSLIELLRVEVDARVATLAGAADVEAKLGRLERFLDQVRAAVQAANRRVERMVAPDAQALPESTTAPPEWQAREDFYAALEADFRGSRDDIRKRVETFVAVVQQVQAGTESAPILDLGCGRGEWLEVLRDNGLVARGVDLNGIFVAQCRELGLDAEEGDALAALESLADHSLGAVTAFHLVEHLPLESMLRLFEQSLRVLKPGGVLILETPNPENLTVGACNFYLDPTHRNPLPPPLLEFIGRHCGFPRLEIRRLSEFRIPGSLADLPEAAADAAVLNPVIALVRQAWYGPPDYALVAHTA